MLRKRPKRYRIPWGAEMLYFPILLALFAGIGDPFLALTLKKPKENHCFWLRTLKNLRKTFVFAFPRASGDPGGTIGPTTPKKLYITNSRSTAQAAVMLGGHLRYLWRGAFRPLAENKNPFLRFWDPKKWNLRPQINGNQKKNQLRRWCFFVEKRILIFPS